MSVCMHVCMYVCMHVCTQSFPNAKLWLCQRSPPHWQRRLSIGNAGCQGRFGIGNADSALPTPNQTGPQIWHWQRRCMQPNAESALATPNFALATPRWHWQRQTWHWQRRFGIDIFAHRGHPWGGTNAPGTTISMRRPKVILQRAKYEKLTVLYIVAQSAEEPQETPKDM